MKGAADIDAALLGQVDGPRFAFSKSAEIEIPLARAREDAVREWILVAKAHRVSELRLQPRCRELAVLQGDNVLHSSSPLAQDFSSSFLRPSSAPTKPASERRCFTWITGAGRDG